MALQKSFSWDSRSLSSVSSRGDFSRSGRSNASPPYALDDDNSAFSRSSLESRGFRDGGPKEARLKRVAFLSLEKDVSHLHPVKIQNLPANTSPERLREKLEKSFGDLEDLYIPMSPQRRKPVADFAIARFRSPSTVDLACSSPSSTIDGLCLSPLTKQRSFFSGGTGYHGISNEPVEDGTYVRGAKPVTQNISLESCMSRSGYPWGSIRELKFLPPHIPPEARETFAIEIENLDRSVTTHDLEAYFSTYGEVASVNCPKPLVIKDRVYDPNAGRALIRFFDRRDVQQALEDVQQGRIQFNGQVVTGKLIKPSHWPSTHTRRYY